MRNLSRNFILIACSAFLSSPVWSQPTIQSRNLAASCAACHGTNGRSVGGTPFLAGMERGFFIKQMQDFKSGARPATVMHQHAKGYTEEEIKLLADFFSSQKP